MSPSQEDWNRNTEWEWSLRYQQQPSLPTPAEAALQMQRAAEQQRLYEQQIGQQGRVPQQRLFEQQIEQQRRRDVQELAYLRQQQLMLEDQGRYVNATTVSYPRVTPLPLVPLREGVPPQQITPVMAEIERLEDNARRQQQDDRSPREDRKEKARVALGTALNEAVLAGLLTEARAVTMIVAGGLNDRSMSTEGAIAQVTAALAQAVQSGVFSRAAADTFLARVGADMALGQGQVRPQPTDAQRDTQGQLERRDDLIYAALTLRPCHLPEHQERHRASVWVCDAQAAVAWGTMLVGLEIDPALLPRVAHLKDDGDRAACCQRDGNIGTWLRWGQLIAPPHTPTPVEKSA